MKKTIILLALFLVNMSITAQKFGHFDYMEVLSAIPEFATVQSEMETLAKQYEDDLKRMQDEFQEKKGALEQQKNLLPNIRQRQEQELQTLLQRIEQTYADSEQALQKANAEKMKPLADKIAVAVEKVCEEGDYVYILNTNTGIPFHINAKHSTDLTADVKKALGL